MNYAANSQAWFEPEYAEVYGHGANDLLNLVIEISGEKKKDKAAKVATARTLWVPAVNNHAGFGRWAFLEVADPWDAQNLIRGALQKAKQEERTNQDATTQA